MAVLSSVALIIDVLHLICQHITCNAAATLWLYRSVKLDFSTSHAPSAFSFRNGNDISHHPLVQDVAVLGLDPYSSRPRLAELTESICSMPNLRRFSNATATAVRLFAG